MREETSSRECPSFVKYRQWYTTLPTALEQKAVSISPGLNEPQECMTLFEFTCRRPSRRPLISILTQARACADVMPPVARRQCRAWQHHRGRPWRRDRTTVEVEPGSLWSRERRTLFAFEGSRGITRPRESELYAAAFVPIAKARENESV
jgi:hypothetical protein